MLGVGENAFDHLFGITLLPKNGRAVLRMLVERGVDLVVEVVQQRGHAPQLLVLAEMARIGADGRLDRKRMPKKRLALRVAGQGLPSALASGFHGVGDRKSTRLNSSYVKISYAVFCLKKKK